MKPATPGRGKRGPVTSSTLLPRAAVCPRPAPAQHRPKGGGLRHPRSAQRARVTLSSPAGQASRIRAGLRWERRGTPSPGGLRGRPRRSRPPLPGAGAPASLPLSIILGRLRVCRSLLVVAVNHSVCPSSIGKTKLPYAGKPPCWGLFLDLRGDGGGLSPTSVWQCENGG